MSSENIRRVDATKVSDAVRRIYQQATIIALVGNAFLLAVKAFAAYLSESSAIYADMANSAADLAYSILMMLGLWLSLKPADRNHPHGHERIESLVSVIIGLFMALAGYEALTHAIATWQDPQILQTPLWLLVVPLATMLLKGGMYSRVKALARKVSSPGIEATARDNLADMMTASVVLVSIVATRIAMPLADPIAGVLVSIWIFYQAASVVYEGIGQLIGKAGSPETERAIIDQIRNIPQIEDIDQVIVEHVGPGVRADIHIYVHGETTLNEVHQISHAVREAVEALDGIDHAFVHVEPTEKVRTSA